MENPININSYIDYNDPVDNKNIAYLGIPTIGILKCFQITPGIWVTPEISNKVTRDINTESRNQYLKNISLYFQRLAQFPIGSSFLNVISQASPYKYYKEFQNETKEHLKGKLATVFIVDHPKTRKCIGVANMSILVKMGENIERDGNKAKNMKYDKSIYNRQSYGNIAVIEFYAQHIESIFSENSFFFKDPMITLFHELIHGLHNLYDYNLDTKVNVNSKEYSLEEVITYGGKRDLELLKEHLNQINQQYLKNMQHIIDNLNKSRKLGAFKEFYSKKYFLEKQKDYTVINNGEKKLKLATQRYILTKEGGNRLTKLLQSTFTEMGLATDSKQMGFDSYYDTTDIEYYHFNPFDKRFYDIQNGLHQESFKEYIQDNHIKPIE